MSSDEKKTWGTIFLDAGRESSLSKLDAMQAASRQEQWQQKSQQDYLERVRQKAIDRAREILGEAYTERQSVLDEAERDGERIRAEARAAHTAAEETRSAAQEIRHQAQAELDNATHIRNAAHEEGFQAGLAQAQDELTNFRMAMGSSVAGVLHVIESQCPQIFAHWREQLVDLLKASIKYGTALALSERHEKVLESMLLEAVRQLDERRSVTLHVHPEDEPVVADLFGAAKEKNPDLGIWKIVADSSLNPGDIIAESLTGTVESRVESYMEMVDNIVRHLSLPESDAEATALEQVHSAVEQEISEVEAITPTFEPEPEPVPEPSPELSPGPEVLPEATSETAYAEDTAAFQVYPDEVLEDTSPISTQEAAQETAPEIMPEAGTAPIAEPRVGANPEEKATIQNLFSMGFTEEDLAEAASTQPPLGAAGDYSQGRNTQPLSTADELLAEHMSPLLSQEQAIEEAAAMDFDHVEHSMDAAMQAQAQVQAQATESRAPSTLQELEDELLGSDFLPPAEPLPGDESYEGDSLFGNDNLVKDKI